MLVLVKLRTSVASGCLVRARARARVCVCMCVCSSDGDDDDWDGYDDDVASDTHEASA